MRLRVLLNALAGSGFPRRPLLGSSVNRAIPLTASLFVVIVTVEAIREDCREKEKCMITSQLSELELLEVGPKRTPK
jgi:hypothetical protein